ncbi:HTH-type transcriptional regulator LutR [Anaerolineae bacterium]|nr:HTH-type transcriptional regulator LutR [Anaerolineae bacterium]
MQIHKLRTDSTNSIHLSRETLPEQVSKHLLQYITDEKMQPGDLLPSVASLATEFGVSRPVIREALKSIAALGIIEIVKGKGAIVKTVDDDLLRIFFQRTLQMDSNSLTALMEVRKPLEMQGAILAAQRYTEEDLKTMEDLVAGLKQNMSNPERYTSLDTEFHVTISRASQNHILYSLIASIRNAMKDSMITLRANREAQGRLGDEQKLHEAILAGIKARNIEAARKAMETHLNETLLLIAEPDHTPSA